MSENALEPQNFEWTSGDDGTITVTVTDKNNDPVDITGSTITWAMGLIRTGSVILTKTVGNGVVISDGPSGVFVVTLNQADAENLIGDFDHEAQVILASGQKKTVLRGTVTIPRDLIA